MSNIVYFNASESAIDEVTVYQTNRAEIKRTIEINLKAGQNDVEVSGLPVYLLPESIHVDVLKNAAILDVIYKPAPIVPFSPYNEPPAAQGLLERREELESQKRILKSQERVLDSYAKSIDAKSVSPDRFVGFLDLFTDKKAIVEEQLSKLARDIKEVDKSIAEARVEASTEDSQRSIKIVIVASAFAEGPTKFILSYAVGGAQWTPLYDLRASVTQSAKVPPLLEVRYRAEIWQSTGEDWNGVKLVLSTASPQTGGDIPTLSAHHINEDRGRYYSSRHRSYSPSYPVMVQPPQAVACMPGAPVVITSPRYARSRSPSRSRSRRRSRSRSWSPDRARRRAHDPSPPPAFVPAMPAYPAPLPIQPPIIPQATAQEGMISATFEVEALATVPSSTIEQYESHKVTIAVLKFEDIQLEWVTVPKVLPSVFLRCKVKNASNYLLLPGSASIFMDNSFISKSDLSLVSPQETFSFSLGIDPEVKATYHPIRKVTSKTGGIFNSKTITTSYVQAISVKSNRRMTLSNLTIKDNVPVSSDSRIKVNLLHPKGLQDPNDKAGSSKVTGAKEVRVSSGVVARWAAIAGDRTAVVDDNVEDDVEGTILWACNIPPGVSQDVQLSWEVTAPVGLKWK